VLFTISFGEGNELHGLIRVKDFLYKYRCNEYSGHILCFASGPPPHDVRGRGS